MAHDGGCEGHSLPYLAFIDRETAHRWARANGGQFSVARVPIYPEIPKKEWFWLEEDVFHVEQNDSKEGDST